MTDKSVLIIPTPRDCEHCDLPFTIDEILGRVVCWEDENGKHCPLRPLPEKLDANDWHRMFSGEYAIREAKGYGYNACLEEIMGETE